MLIHWIWLSHRPGFGPRTKAKLLEHFRDPEAVYYADGEALGQLELSAEARAALLDKNLESSGKILEDCEKKRLNILTIQDAAYPSRLKNIPDPPLVLYYKGQLPDFDSEPVIGVVGTRKASAYGLTVAKRMGYQIGKCGGLVVSGMAYGIDGLAMSGALTAGAKTVGVLGCGADIVYPQSNRSLFRDVERYGCILSEFAPGQPAAKWTFPMRNRIISGLSCGVLVVEAPEKSGALITARLALEQGRDVFAVPGSIYSPLSAAPNRLIVEGAIPALSGWDVLEHYRWASREDASKSAPRPKLELDPEDDQIVQPLLEQELSFDELANLVDFPIAKLNSHLTMLELRGIIVKVPGGMYRAYL